MKRITLGSFVVLVALVSLSGAQGSVEISIGGPEFSGSGAGSVPDNALTLSFDDFAANTVQLTISDNLGAVKVKDIVFTIAPSFTPLGFAYVSGVVATDTDIDANDHKLNDLLDFFDVLFSYSTNGPNGRLFNGQTSVYNLSAPGLTAAAFDQFNNDGAGPLRAAAHINSPNETSPSGKYAGNGVIPEPASLLVWPALTFFSIAALACRRIFA